MEELEDYEDYYFDINIDELTRQLRLNLEEDINFQLDVYSYNADYKEAIDFLKYKKTICQCSYEFQCLLFDIYPEWYEEEVNKAINIGWCLN